ncbi:MAG: FecR domain-containing protein [Zoogloeaceae bacterium]|nr:FecR domain-containing protein [Zoogloeaceae bacterium]
MAVLACLPLLPSRSQAADENPYCTPPSPQESATQPIGRIISSRDAYLVSGSGGRHLANADACLYVDSHLVTGIDGRVALELTRAAQQLDVQPAPVINLGPDSSLKMQVRRERADWVLKLIDGWFQFFSGREAELEVDTPYLTAGVRGTEFALYTDDSACDYYDTGKRGCSALWVQQGDVWASLPRDSESGASDPSEVQASTIIARGAAPDSKIDKDPGEVKDMVIAVAGEPPRFAELRISPQDAVDWVIYYPPLVLYQGGSCADSAHRSGAVSDPDDVRCMPQATFDALVAQYGRDPTAVADAGLAQAGIRLLTESRTATAREMLRGARGPNALALLAVTELKGNDRESARRYADAALVANKALPPGRQSANAPIAMSYVLQSAFDLEAATEAATDAVRIAGADAKALLLARQAELQLAQSNVAAALHLADMAVSEAERAPADAPSRNRILSRAHAVRGFAQLVDLDSEQALQSFRNARRADDLSPLAYLGLGLANIRENRLELGVRQLEIAVALDPRVSLYRSYLGKGYFEQGRLELAKKELDTAKALDQEDPTPWLYDAFVAGAGNDPIAALSATERSKRLNGNRAVYRSQLLLDSDAAVRSADFGRTYAVLGFEQLARLEAAASLRSDPGNYSAHRLLTDSYSREPRHFIARVSELLQARMRAPRIEHPVSAQVADSRLDDQWKAHALPPGHNEYFSMFERDGGKVTASVLSGSKATFKEEVRASWANGPASFAITQLHGETDGYRPKNYQDDDYWNLLGQYRLSSDTSLQLEYRNLRSKYGDSFWGFDADDYFATDDQKEQVSSWRLGGHHVFSPTWDAIALFRRETATLNIDADDGSFSSFADEAGNQAEVQFLGRFRNANLIFGGSYFTRDRFDREDIPLATWDWDTRQQSAYALFNYTTAGGSEAPALSLPGKISITGGTAFEHLRTRVAAFDANEFFGSSELKRERVSPKLGLTWTLPLSSDTAATLRLARFDTVKRALLADETLEPTTIAGFNQFYDDPEGTLAKTTAAGVDFALPKHRLASGIAIVRRELDTLEIDRYVPELLTDDIAERTITAYINWLASPKTAVGVTYTREVFDRNPNTFGGERIIDSRTDRVVAMIRHFMASGVSLSLEPVWIRQRGEFVTVVPSSYSGNGEFVILNASVSARFQSANALISLDIQNALDRRFNYQDTDPFAPRFTPERAVFVRAVLSF